MQSRSLRRDLRDVCCTLRNSGTMNTRTSRSRLVAFGGHIAGVEWRETYVDGAKEALAHSVRIECSQNLLTTVIVVCAPSPAPRAHKKRGGWDAVRCKVGTCRAGRAHLEPQNTLRGVCQTPLSAGLSAASPTPIVMRRGSIMMFTVKAPRGRRQGHPIPRSVPGASENRCRAVDRHASLRCAPPVRPRSPCGT